ATSGRRRRVARRPVTSGAHSVSTDLDDHPGGHSRSLSPGPGHRPGRPDAATAGHHGHRRPDCQHALYPHCHSRRLPGHGAQASAVKTSSGPGALAGSASGPGRRVTMKTWILSTLGLVPVLMLTQLHAQEPKSMERVQTIALKGKAGNLDHLAIDQKRQRLFVANKANNTL